MKLKKKAILYMEGMLDQKEEVRFKNAIKNRPDIKQFMEEYRRIEAGLKRQLTNSDFDDADEKSLENLDRETKQDIKKYLTNYGEGLSSREKSFIQVLNQQKKKKTKRRNLNLSLILNVAASIAFIFLVVNAIIHFSGNKKKMAQLNLIFTEYFNPFDDPELPGINSNIVKFEGQKLVLTEKGSLFQNSEINSILRNNSLKSEDLFMLSLLLIQEGDFNLPELYLNDIIQGTEKNLKDNSTFYLSMIYIKNGEVKNAKENLNILCLGNSFYSNIACDILKTLKEKNIE